VGTVFRGVSARVSRESEAVMTVDQRAVSHEARQSGFSGFESAHAHKELAHRSAGRRCKCRSDAEV
jgi:hypothetical protein